MEKIEEDYELIKGIADIATKADICAMYYLSLKKLSMTKKVSLADTHNGIIANIKKMVDKGET
jgi:hypothetical protein